MLKKPGKFCGGAEMYVPEPNGHVVSANMDVVEANMHVVSANMDVAGANMHVVNTNMHVTVANRHVVNANTHVVSANGNVENANTHVVASGCIIAAKKRLLAEIILFITLKYILMNHVQIAKDNMYQEMKKFFEQNAVSFNAFGRAKQEITTFTTNNAALNEYIQQQAGITGGFTNAKDNAFDNMVKLTVKTSRKALVYATDRADDQLIALFNVQEDDFVHGSNTEGLAKIENVYDGLVPLREALADYRVTPEDIDKVDRAITAYENVEGEPGTAAAAKKAGTEGIKTMMLVIDQNLDLLDDLVIHGMDDDIDFVNEYRACRRLHEVGTRHTGLVATINDAATGLGIEYALMKVVELGKEAKSDILGVADIPSMKDGIFHVSFSAGGYVPVTKILTIERGRTLEVTLELVKV